MGTVLRIAKRRAVPFTSDVIEETDYGVVMRQRDLGVVNLDFHQTDDGELMWSFVKNGMEVTGGVVKAEPGLITSFDMSESLWERGPGDDERDADNAAVAAFALALFRRDGRDDVATILFSNDEDGPPIVTVRERGKETGGIVVNFDTMMVTREDDAESAPFGLVFS